MFHKVYLLTRGWNIKVIDLYLNYLLEYLDYFVSTPNYSILGGLK